METKPELLVRQNPREGFLLEDGEKSQLNSRVDVNKSLAISLQKISINILARGFFVCLFTFSPSNFRVLSLEKNKNKELRMDIFFLKIQI